MREIDIKMDAHDMSDKHSRNVELEIAFSVWIVLTHTSHTVIGIHLYIKKKKLNSHFLSMR